MSRVGRWRVIGSKFGRARSLARRVYWCPSYDTLCELRTGPGLQISEHYGVLTTVASGTRREENCYPIIMTFGRNRYR
ncbi:hypothetical protein PITC_089670 [Penicillium italicum]|uniref:Uncharacterized protein n=1 Tax=Penicillium italicum TaxID=40296 RepID=A0A0A2LA70_PENIT|nr:hypothetical protein PITC_089670 [Penicillium italicum]